MKKKLILLLVLSFAVVISYSQTYSFSKLLKKVIINTPSGDKQKIIDSVQGTFRFVFETPTDPKIKRLFTILSPGQENKPGLPWFGLMKDMGYIEKDNKLLKKTLYYDTENDAKVLTLIAEDYSVIVIFKADGVVWEFIK